MINRVPDWTRMRASEEWTPVLRTRFRVDADYDAISALPDGLDEMRSTLPVARLETDFRARTLTNLMESPSDSEIGTWRAIVEDSRITEEIENAQLPIGIARARLSLSIPTTGDPRCPRREPNRRE